MIKETAVNLQMHEMRNKGILSMHTNKTNTLGSNYNIPREHDLHKQTHAYFPP